MKQKFTALIMTAVMAFSVMAAVPEPVHAAATPFMTVVCDGPVKEKVGNYYIWVKTTEDEYGDLSYELRSAKKANVKGNLLKSVAGGDIITSVISNGQTIYYGVLYSDNKMIIYRTSVTGKNHIKFRTVNNVQRTVPYAENMCGPITVFNNRLYYDRDTTDIAGNVTWNIYSVNLHNKNCRLEKTGFKGQSGYGRYITCDNELKNIKTQLYNVKSRKSTVLIKSKMSRVHNGKIYYGNWDNMGAYVKSSNLNGKNLETVGAQMIESEWHITYLGKKMAYFLNSEWGSNNKCKLIYATKKFVKIK